MLKLSGATIELPSANRRIDDQCHLQRRNRTTDRSQVCWLDPNFKIKKILRGGPFLRRIYNSSFIYTSLHKRAGQYDRACLHTPARLRSSSSFCITVFCRFNGMKSISLANDRNRKQLSLIQSEKNFDCAQSVTISRSVLHLMERHVSKTTRFVSRHMIGKSVRQGNMFRTSNFYCTFNSAKNI